MASVPGRLRRLPDDHPVAALLVAVLACEIVGASGALFTAQGLESWYGTLTRPDLAPPNWVFAPVWTTLFALMGVAVWLVWRRASGPAAASHVGQVRTALGVFAVHFAFN